MPETLAPEAAFTTVNAAEAVRSIFRRLYALTEAAKSEQDKQLRGWMWDDVEREAQGAFAELTRLSKAGPFPEAGVLTVGGERVSLYADDVLSGAWGEVAHALALVAATNPDRRSDIVHDVPTEVYERVLLDYLRDRRAHYERYEW